MAAWISCINHGSDIYRSLISIDMHSRHKKRSWQFVNQFELLMELWINGCKVSFCIFFSGIGVIGSSFKMCSCNTLAFRLTISLTICIFFLWYYCGDCIPCYIVALSTSTFFVLFFYFHLLRMWHISNSYLLGSSKCLSSRFKAKKYIGKCKL
jgi:hypothetical protein